MLVIYYGAKSQITFIPDLKYLVITSQFKLVGLYSVV